MPTWPFRSPTADMCWRRANWSCTASPRRYGTTRTSEPRIWVGGKLQRGVTERYPAPELKSAAAGAFSDELTRVDELVAKPWMNFGIENLFEPIDGESATRRLTGIRVIRKP